MMIDIRKALVLVPHEDDEVMLAGNTIRLLHNAGIEVYVLFSTNGDLKFRAEQRITEALHSLKVLGEIDKDHVILLGYGDNYNNLKSHTHYYYVLEDKDSTNRKFTYGAAGIQDYGYIKHGKHSTYDRLSFLSDLKEAILDISADLLICIDFDEHPDHRMLSLCFDQAMAEILSTTDYMPYVLKGFAYSTAYTAVNDFYGDILADTVRPKVGITEKYKFDFIDTTVYTWEDRIRVPSPPDAKNRLLLTNQKAKALRMHKSQHAILRGERIINADEVFWERRTDSLSYKAIITVSSGEAHYLNDFKTYNVNEIDSEIPNFTNYLWQPYDEDKEAVFTWKTPQTISSMKIFGNIEEDSLITKIQITMNNGFSKVYGPLPIRGRCLNIQFSLQENITELVVKILEANGDNFGISECEIYGVQKLESLNDLIHDLIHEFKSNTVLNHEKNVELKKVINKVYLLFISFHKKLVKVTNFIQRRGIRGIFNKCFQLLTKRKT